MRFVLVGVMALAMAFPSSVRAEEEAPTLDRTGYDVAMLCVLANSAAGLQRKNSGDPDGAAQYQEKAEDALRVAFGFGEVLGLNEPEVQRDFEALQQRELPKLIGDMDYLLRAVRTCKAYGLM